MQILNSISYIFLIIVVLFVVASLLSHNNSALPGFLNSYFGLVNSSLQSINNNI